jgi:heme A synthase
MSRLRLALVALSGAVLAAALVVLLSQPWRLLRCATPTSSSEVPCQPSRAWDWPGILDLVGASLLGALVATLLAAPFLRRG